MTTTANPDHARNLQRMIGLVGKLFLAVSEQWTPYFLYREDDDGQHVTLFARPRQDYNKRPFDSENTTKEGQLALLSHNYCTTAVRDFAGLIATVTVELEIPLQCEEVHVTGVKPVRFVALEVDKSARTNVAGIHTMFKITRRSDTPKALVPDEGFYVDPSAGQYYKPPGLSDVASFQWDLIHEQPKVRKFGSEYSARLEEFLKLEEDLCLRDHIRVCQTEAKTRLLNNILYQQLIHDGGLTARADFVDSGWATKERSIVEAVKHGVTSLREEVWRMQRGEKPKMDYTDLVRDKFGDGHERMVQAIEQLSGLPFDHMLEMG